MKATEDKPDNTTAEGSSPWRPAYNAEPGWRIISVVPKAATTLSQRIGTGIKEFPMPNGELVQRFTVQGDHTGEEAGTWTQVQVSFNTVTVELEKVP
jgi:hypothetical protein